MEKKPHKHAEVIRAWADGNQIEFLAPSGKWIDADPPAFVEDYSYRVKPALNYPLTGMTASDLRAIWNREQQGGVVPALFRVASDSIRHAIDNGQVVTREEFKRLSDELGRAVCSLKAYGYTDEGGDLWKPPLGPRHVSLDERASRDLAVSMAVRDKCRDLTVKHAMRSGVVHDIERLDLFAIIDSVEA